MNKKTPMLLPLANSAEELEERLKLLKKWQPRGGMACLVEGQRCVKIPVGKHGLFALIDEDDYPRVGQFYWGTTCKPTGPNYAVRCIGENNQRKVILMHCQIMEFPEIECDHKNHDGFDNRRINLRPATRLQNMMN